MLERLSLNLPRAEQNGWQRESFCERRLRTRNTEASLAGLYFLHVNPRAYPNQRIEFTGEHSCALPFEISGVRSLRSNLSHVSSWSDSDRVWLQETTESTVVQPGPEQPVVFRNRVEYKEAARSIRWDYTRNGRQVFAFFIERPEESLVRTGIEYSFGSNIRGSYKYSGQFGGPYHQNHSVESSRFGNWRFGYFYNKSDGSYVPFRTENIRFNAGVEGLGGKFDEGEYFT